jgi:hydrogenase maturation protease
MTKERSEIIVIGIGNDFRCDDAAGLVVAQRLKNLLPTSITVCEQSGDGLLLIDSWKDAQKAILIDAVYSGGQPGEIYRFDAYEQPIPATFFHLSSHALSVAEAIELSWTLGSIPPKLIVYGIEANRFTAGTILSAEIKKAIEKVITLIIDEIV